MLPFPAVWREEQNLSRLCGVTAAAQSLGVWSVCVNELHYCYGEARVVFDLPRVNSSDSEADNALSRKMSPV